MTASRRRVLQVGGASLAVLLVPTSRAPAADVVDITMLGRPDGSHVWFDPFGIHVLPGQSIRWTNRDPGNSHTVTAYHPSIFDRPLRIPAGAGPWDSGYLLPDEHFSLTLRVEGVYDYYCAPHEQAGMVGRIVVGSGKAEPANTDLDTGLVPLPEAALAGFPDVAAILAAGAVRHD